WDFVREAIHALDIVDELRHSGIIERMTNPRDVELREMMVDGLPYRHHSAASAACGAVSRTPWLSALREYSSMRRSISGRKCRNKPCTGQAAPSPKAQMV